MKYRVINDLPPVSLSLIDEMGPDLTCIAK